MNYVVHSSKDHSDPVNDLTKVIKDIEFSFILVKTKASYSCTTRFVINESIFKPGLIFQKFVINRHSLE